jgi:hypothetical protein
MRFTVLRDERGSFTMPILYVVIALLSLQLTVYGISRYWISVMQEDIQSKLDISNMACYPNLNLENLADTASVMLQEAEAKKTFEAMLARQLDLNEQTLAADSGKPIQRVEITRFKIYRQSEVPATLPGGRQILRSPAIESEITAHVRIPFIGGVFPHAFRSVTDLPQTP